MFKFKEPNPGLKQYQNLTAEQYFREVFKRNESAILQSTGGLISEQQWVSKMQSIAENTGYTPREIIRAEAESKIYQTEDDFAAIQARKALQGSQKNGQTAYDWMRRNARDSRGHFVSPTSGEWLPGGIYQIGNYRLTFKNSPEITIAEIFNKKTGEWEQVAEFDEPTDDYPITRIRGKLS